METLCNELVDLTARGECSFLVLGPELRIQLTQSERRTTRRETEGRKEIGKANALVGEYLQGLVFFSSGRVIDCLNPGRSFFIFTF